MQSGVAVRVLAQAKAEKLWLAMIALERRRLGINQDGSLSEVHRGAVNDGDYRGNFSIIPLTNLLRYLEDRAHGRPVDTVNHVHDKPIDLNVNVSMAELLREVRERKQKYERSRN